MAASQVAQPLPRDFALLPNSWELDLSRNDMRLNNGVESIGQDIRIRLGWWLGEWQQDESLGIDYAGSVFVKNPNPDGIKGAFRDAALSAAGVSAVPTVTADIDKRTRALTSTVVANSDLGQLTVYLNTENSSSST